MDRRELIDNLSAQLEQLDARIDELETKAEKAEAGAQHEYDKQIKNLRNKMTLAQEKMKEMKESGDEDWNELREGAEKAMYEVDSAIKSAVSRFQ